MDGCYFCDVVMQSFMLLQDVEKGMSVELALWPRSPVELHSLANKDVYDAVEIYPCPSKCQVHPTSRDRSLSSIQVANTTHTYPEVCNDVPRQLSLEASEQFLRENYYSCITEHEQCRPEIAFLPKRVIDISESIYKLVEPARDTKGLYATLSYSWGGKGFAMATSGSYEALKHGFDGKSLPKTFQDAATMARSLHIRYLWIDTLCIIQDSITDWEEESPKMGEIFGGAAITIAASSSPHPDHTLFKTREPRYQEVELYNGAAGGPHDVVFKARRKIRRGIHAKIGRSTDTDADPLDARAWGLQERLLSTRLIAFTGTELQWTCRTLKSCECHQNPQPSQPLFPAPTGLSRIETTIKHSRSWIQVIEDYSNRKLTNPNDKLPALSGLASKFGNVTGFTYIAGLWKESILYDLVWQRDIGPVSVSSTWLAPSFSWASAPSPVHYRFARHVYPGSRIEHAKLVNFYYEAIGHGTYTRAMDCTLTLRGYTVAAHLRRTSEDSQAYAICIDNTIYLPNSDQRTICEFSIDAAIPQCNEKIDAEASEWKSLETVSNEPIILLSLYSIHHRRYLYQNFLILRKSHQDVNTYERIGIGSGKLYREGGSISDIPSKPRLVRPFEWLSVDLGKRGRSIGNLEEQVMYIR
jgi:hypothetical protein